MSSDFNFTVKSWFLGNPISSHSVRGETGGHFRFRRPCLLAKSRLQSHRGLQGSSTQWDEVFYNKILLFFMHLRFHEIFLKISRCFMLYVPVISWFAAFWSMNICYCIFSAPQTQFKAEKKMILVVNVFCLTNKKFPFSVKRKRKQTFILQNSKIRQINK